MSRATALSEIHDEVARAEGPLDVDALPCLLNELRERWGAGFTDVYRRELTGCLRAMLLPEQP